VRRVPFVVRVVGAEVERAARTVNATVALVAYQPHSQGQFIRSFNEEYPLYRWFHCVLFMFEHSLNISNNNLAI